MTTRVTRTEQTGWRDLALSARHRRYGFDCPAVDLDFIMVEFDTLTPVALIEYKRENAPVVVASKNVGVTVLVKLADMAQLPAFLVRYARGFEWFRVKPLNEMSRAKLVDVRQMTEREYVTFLYGLRGREMPADVAKLF